MRSLIPRPASRVKLKHAMPERAPPLRLTPYAWQKLLFLRDAGPTEVGGFGISAADDLLLVEDLHLVRQQCGLASVLLEDTSVADYFDTQVDAGRSPEQFARIWFHTHPGSSPLPSSVDEETFERCFGAVDWSIMFILAAQGEAYARLRFGAGPGGNLLLPVEIEFGQSFPASAVEAWQVEYVRNVSRLADWTSSGLFSDRAGLNLDRAGQPVTAESESSAEPSNSWEGAYDRCY